MRTGLILGVAGALGAGALLAAGTLRLSSDPPLAGLQVFPFFGFLLAVVLGFVFRQSRIAYLSCLMAAPAALILRSGGAMGAAASLFAGLAIPPAAVALYLLPERNVTSPAGARRAAVLAGTGMGVLLLSAIPGIGDAVRASQAWTLRPIWEAVQISPVSLLLLLASAPVLGIAREHESRALGLLLWAAVCYCVAGLGALAAEGALSHTVGLLLLAAAALTLVWAAVVSAWRHANMDELTELPGRRPLEYELRNLEQPFALAVVDLDHFKKVNDTYGHDVGDQVLRFLAAQLRTSRAGAAYRQGGEEFVILSRGPDFKEFGESLEELRLAVARKEFRLRAGDRPMRSTGRKQRGRRASNGAALRLTISIGAARSGGRRHTAQEVLDAADRALYDAKSQGRNRLCVA